MGDAQSEQLRVLREILKWIRFTGMKEVKSVLISALDTDQKKIIYQLSDGQISAREIARQTALSDKTVRNYWGLWARIGVVEAIKAGAGERYKRSFDLEDLGIEAPKLATSIAPKQEQPTEQEQPGEPKLEEFQRTSEGKTDA
ncbi:MAG TPA: hypothetical protein VJ044_03060 [Candidatus Hodarchaeales archaeon]|nr:hypothetical protein [Candidatus Hodarchaeales archaeon]